MKFRTSPVAVAALTAVAACSSAKVAADKNAAEPKVDRGSAPAAPSPAATAPTGPVAEKAQLLREAASQLEKAAAQLERGNRNLAEQLFSTAELLVGPEALSSLAPQFREGAPPRVTTPTQRVDTSVAPQPKVAGNSEDEDEAAKVPPPRIETGSLTGTLMIGGKGAGAFGLVTLEPASGKWKQRTPKRVVIEQRGREFLPALVAVSVGSTISFPNFDSVFHNVFSTAPQAPFDLGLYKAGEAREFKFEKEGIIRLGCNLHANMSAHIAVVSAPSYVVTDEQGAFAFRRVAPGKYKLRAWSVRSKEPVTQEITIKAGKNTVEVGVSGDAPPGAQPDKFGGKRG